MSVLPRALRFANGKPPLSWLDQRFVQEMAMVLYAASEPAGGKYPVNNWRLGAPVSESLNSAMRHLAQVIDGEYADSETRRAHLAHAAINCMFVFCTLRDTPQHDDRYIRIPTTKGAL